MKGKIWFQIEEDSRERARLCAPEIVRVIRENYPDSNCRYLEDNWAKFRKDYAKKLCDYAFVADFEKEQERNLTYLLSSVLERNRINYKKPFITKKRKTIGQE